MSKIEVNISGIKCDSCNFRDDSVIFSDYYKYINKKCPNCGENLLTESDYKKCLSIVRFINFLNKINNILKWINPFHYYRLIFGDKRKIVTISKKY